MMDDLKNSMILYDMDLNNKKVVVMCFGIPDKYYEDDLQEKDMRDEIMKESKLSIVLDDKEYAESFCNDLRTSIKENEWGYSEQINACHKSLQFRRNEN